MISEKEMMIVDAVNELKAGCAPSRRCKTIYRVGDEALNFGMDVTEDTVCTVEEYNQCIREMSEGAFVPNAKPEFVYGQDVYLKDDEWKGIKLKFGCLSLSGNWAILLHECGYAYVKLDNVSSKPFKTKKEIELEEAKKLQILELMYFYQKHYDRVGTEDFLKDMQENGHLAEIILPLELK